MKGTLLIVDDEPMLLQRLKFNLEEYADNILLAENGMSAIQIIESNTIHCIICDINMPQMSGVEVLKRIREAGIQTPFIFYTGHGNKELMIEAAKYGAFDFLDKPSLDGLEEVVERGLKLGTSTPEPQIDSASSFRSEYSRLLAELEKE